MQMEHFLIGIYGGNLSEYMNSWGHAFEKQKKCFKYDVKERLSHVLFEDKKG